MNIPKFKKVDSLHIAVCASGLKFDAWKLYKWVEAYRKSGIEAEPVLFFSELNHDSLFYWPYDTVEINELFTYTNMEFLKYHQDNLYSMKSIFVKMLACKYLGPCIVIDADCHINQKITYNTLPTCTWGAVTQYDRIPGKQQPWHNLEHINFEEFDYVEQIYDEFMIFNQDYSDSYFELYHKYKDEFYHMSFYPNYASVILSLAHKKANGTFLSSSWCQYFDSPNSDSAICKLFSGVDGYNKLFKDTYDIPYAEVTK